MKTPKTTKTKAPALSIDMLKYGRQCLRARRRRALGNVSFAVLELCGAMKDEAVGVGNKDLHKDTIKVCSDFIFTLGRLEGGR